jgi:SAM-dependent methyltransferase
MPFEEEFDVVGAFDVLEHVPEDGETLKQIRQVVAKNGGGLLLTVPQHMSLWSYVDEFSCHCRRYEADELAEKLEKAGFTVLALVSFVSLLLPLMYLQRKRQSQQNFNPEKEISLSSFVNAALEAALNFELGLIKTGFRFPKGGSLLAVAVANDATPQLAASKELVAFASKADDLEDA